ncbi:MAG: 2-C-methyl-D-erythritol 4-phosphate cytidylyltransferase [bacterium]
MKNAVIVVAAGRGKRFKHKLPKQFVKVRGREILALSLDNFEKTALIDAVVLVVSAAYADYARKMTRKYGYKKIIGIINGGTERFNSVYNAVTFLKAFGPENVLIHDGARPKAGKVLIKKILTALKKEKAVIPVNRIFATVKKVKGNYIENTIDRNTLRTAHTPQGFKYKELLKLYELSNLKSKKPTDDAAVFEAAGVRVKIIEDEEENVKVTVRKDINKV